MVESDSVRVGPARMNPPSVASPPLVTEIAPALASLAAELMNDPNCWVNVPPATKTMLPPCAGLPSFVFALETMAPGIDDDVP